jgi:hypothetical protein
VSTATAQPPSAWQRWPRTQWYSHYELRIAKVERAYGWDRGDGPRPGDDGV